MGQTSLISLPSDLNFRSAFGSFDFHLSKHQAKKIQPQLPFHPSPKVVKFPYLNPYQMESSEEIELINLAIQRLLEERRIKDASGDKLSEDDDEQFLSRLLSQLESLKGDGSGTLKQSELEELRVEKAEAKSENGSQVESGCGGGIGVEEMVKELKAVKRQNTITHCLLSALIVVTVIWQLSEVSLVLKVKNGLTNPFKSFGNMLAKMLKNRGINNAHNADKTTKHHHNQLTHPSSSGPSVKFPDLPHAEFPHLGSSGEGHRSDEIQIHTAFFHCTQLSTSDCNPTIKTGTIH